MNSLVRKLYYHPLAGHLFHTLDHCLKNELKDCDTVLDLGCGPSSPIQHCKHIKYSVGVEAFKPYMEISKKKKIHTKYILGKIEGLDFPQKSFDAVIMIEVLEHLPKKVGMKVIKMAERWAKKTVILTTPNGYFPMGKVDNNQWQKHLSGWSYQRLRKLGFRVNGMAGIKYLYQDSNNVNTLLTEEENSYVNMKYKPKILCYMINSVIQIFSFYTPKLSFGLLAVKNV